MGRLFQHITPLIVLVFSLLANPFQSYSQGIELERVSIAPGGGLQISYNIEGDLSNIDNLKIRFYHDLNNLNDHAEETITNYDEFNQTIPLPPEIDYSNQIHVRLDLYYTNGASFQTKIHSAIFLKSIESLSEACDYSIETRWSNYAIYPKLANGPQFPPIFNELQIFMFEYNEANDQSYKSCNISTNPIYTIPYQPLGDSEEIIDLSSIQGISGGDKYCFRVTAVNTETGIYSHSNMLIGIELQELARPEKVEIRSVDVIGNEAIEIKVDVDDIGFSQFEYTLQRSDNAEIDFEDIDKVTYPGREVVFRDVDIPDFESNPWYYRVVADMKECEMDDPPRSVSVSSIFLNASVDFYAGIDNEVQIIMDWMHEDSTLDRIYEYNLIKELEDETIILYNTIGEPYTFTDILQLDQVGSEVKYFVQATHANLDEPIHSNYFLFSPEWLKPPPNAFRPASEDEANQNFSPEFYYESGISDYSLSIYDRNGLRVFQTSRFGEGEGWDGTIDGQPAPEGAYIYEIRYKIRFEQAEKPVRGVVYLVR